MTIVKKQAILKGNAILSDKVKDRGDDPYFIKKAEQAREIQREVGIPGTRKLNFK